MHLLTVYCNNILTKLLHILLEFGCDSKESIVTAITLYASPRYK
jgi:hypothetical protein